MRPLASVCWISPVGFGESLSSQIISQKCANKAEDPSGFLAELQLLLKVETALIVGPTGFEVIYHV